MKAKLLLITVALALPAMAGTAAYQSTPAPVSTSPSLWSWFIGGSAGYLVDAEEGYYGAQVGVDTPWEVGGWNIAMFAEVAYFQADNRASNKFGLANIDTDVVPVTFNFKFERPLTGNLNAYFGGNLGASFLDINATSSTNINNNVSDNDVVFTASVFAGLVYNVNPAFEVFGGARWIYFDDTNIRGLDVELSDDVLFEGGLRFNF